MTLSRATGAYGGYHRPGKALWLGALVVAVALHAAGFAFAFNKLKPEDPDDALGASALTIGLELASPKLEQSELPPGPEAEASTASSASVTQTAKVEQTDLPKAQPTETDDPDRLVAPDATKTPNDTPTIRESKANTAAESVASEAAAPPVLEAAREAPVSSAPALGWGESAQLIRTTWQKQLLAHFNRFKRYPVTGSHRTAQIVVAFTLDRYGHVVSSTIQKGSGDPAFDRAALAMVEKADPVPPPPPLVADEGLNFSIPVLFRNKTK